MSDIWKKLNLKDQSEIVVVNPPDSFQPELKRLTGIQIVPACGRARAIQFILAFVSKLAEVQRIAKQVEKKAQGDAIVWMAYPKQTSRKYDCEFHRDTGWQSLQDAGFEGVRQVAIDEDWSALRFRRLEFIKKLTRKNRR